MKENLKNLQKILISAIKDNLDKNTKENNEKINNKIFGSLLNKIVKRKNIQFFNNNINLNINLNINFNNIEITKRNIQNDKSSDKFVI